MFKKCNSKIVGIAGIAGIPVNNVKAADAAESVPVYVKIGGKTYSEVTTGKIDKNSIKSFNYLITELEKLTNGNKLKKDGTDTADTLDLCKLSNIYFVKSVKIGKKEKLEDITKFDIRNETIDNKTNKLTIELVKKEDRIKITYDDDKVKGARLLEESEDKILLCMCQCISITDFLSALYIAGLGFSFGDITQNNSDEVIGKDINLFAEDTKLEFKITHITDYYKKVVCNFITGVKEKLVKEVDLEKLCYADSILDENKKLSDEIKALNDVKVDNVNAGIFKSDANLTILENGVGGVKLDESKATSNNCNFILIQNIKEADINPIFLKKSFSVRFDNNGNTDKSVDDNILKKIENTLNTEFKDKVVIKVSDITSTISGVNNGTANDIIKATAFTDLNNISIEGVKNEKNNTLGANDQVNAAKIKITLKEGVFAKGIVLTTIQITCDNLDNKEVKGKKVQKTVIDAIKRIINNTTKIISKADFVKKFNDDTTIKKISAFADTDFNFSNVLATEASSNIDQGGKIVINEAFWNKLTDECFDNKPSGGNPPKNNENNNNGQDGSGKDDDKKAGKCSCYKK